MKFFSTLAVLMALSAGFCAEGQQGANPNTNPGTVTNLFNGRDLTGWKESAFGGQGPVTVTNGEITIETGIDLSGITWTNESILPKANYEVSMEVKKTQGSDFLCGLTLPVGDTFCSFIVGGWGGAVVGISSIDDRDASENETTQYRHFEMNRWYKVRVHVGSDSIQCWIDMEKVVDVKTSGHKIDLRPGPISRSKPLGIATFQTTAVLRGVQLKRD
jgi:hypothetical protein